MIIQIHFRAPAVFIVGYLMWPRFIDPILVYIIYAHFV